jgi:hypothetical protein
MPLLLPTEPELLPEPLLEGAPSAASAEVPESSA